MNANCFFDSNILIYTLDKASEKQDVSFALWRGGAVVSTQVIMEFTNVCIKKLNFSRQDAYENAKNIIASSIVRPITAKSLTLAFEISTQYGFSHWDSLVIASALEARCTVLYSEDLQHNQLIRQKLRIVNPFTLKRLTQ